MKFIYTGFLALNSLFGDKDLFPPPDASGVPFTWEIYVLLSGGQRGRSECPCKGCFSSNFKIINMALWHILGCPALSLNNIYAHTHCKILYMCVCVCTYKCIHVCVYVHIENKGRRLSTKQWSLWEAGSEVAAGRELYLTALGYQNSIVKLKMPESRPCWVPRLWADIFLNTKEMCGCLGNPVSS